MTDTLTKTCYWCGQPFGRTRFSGGRIEGVTKFLSRRYCSVACSSAHRLGAEPATEPGLKRTVTNTLLGATLRGLDQFDLPTLLRLREGIKHRIEDCRNLVGWPLLVDAWERDLRRVERQIATLRQKGTP